MSVGPQDPQAKRDTIAGTARRIVEESPGGQRLIGVLAALAITATPDSGMPTADPSLRWLTKPNDQILGTVEAGALFFTAGTIYQPQAFVDDLVEDLGLLTMRLTVWQEGGTDYLVAEYVLAVEEATTTSEPLYVPRFDPDATIVDQAIGSNLSLNEFGEVVLSGSAMLAAQLHLAGTFGDGESL